MPQSLFKLLRTDPFSRKALLRVLIPHDRTACNLREHADIGTQLPEGGLRLYPAAENIRLIGNQLKDVKAEAQRQKQISRRRLSDLEKSENADICRTRKKHPPAHGKLPSPAVTNPRRLCHTQADKIIQRGHREQQKHKLRLRTGIQQNASDKQRYISMFRRRQIKRNQKNRQESKQEFQTAEYQTIFSD